MRVFLNVWWHITLGFVHALVYALVGLLYCCTVILIPIGLGWLQFAKFLLAPHTSAMVSKSDLALVTGESQGTAMKTFSLIVRILYFPFGLVAAISAIGMTIGFCLSIVGIPNGIVWARSLATIFNPVNKVCVPRSVAEEIERIKGNNTVSSYSGNRQPAGTSDIQVNIEAASSTSAVPPATAASPVRSYTKEKLKEIAASPEMYKDSLVEAARHELEVRDGADGLKEKVAGFDDARLREILSDPETYSDELVYACSIEKSRRDTEREIRLRKEQEEARIKAEQEAEQKRLEKERKMKKYGTWIGCTIVIIIVAAVVASRFTPFHYFKSGMKELSLKDGSFEKAISCFSKIGDKSDYYEDAQIRIYGANMAMGDSSDAASVLKKLIEKGGWNYPEASRIYAEHLREGNMVPYIEKNLQKAVDLYMKSPYSEYRKKGQKILDELEIQRKEAERQRLAEEQRKAAEKRAAELAAQRVEQARIAEQKRVEQELAAAKQREAEAKKKAAYEKKRAAAEHERRMRTDVAYRHKFGIFEVGDRYFGKDDTRILSLDDTGQHGVLMVWGIRNDCYTKSYAEAVEAAKKLGGRLATKEELTKYKRYIYHTQFWISPGRVYCTDDSVRYQREMDAERSSYDFCMIRKF